MESLTADADARRAGAHVAMPGVGRQRLEVHGAVQGVGFRPYVVRLARALGIDGWVRNAGGHVVIEASGPPDSLAALAMRLPEEAPPHAVVRKVIVVDLNGDRRPDEHAGFTVAPSVAVEGRRDFPPDLATCDDCLRELFDPADRRYRYPFINCTACGPRATIITELPYDRLRTTMAPFELCAACAAEYADPADRRFHAEPVACPVCGPRLTWVPNGATGDTHQAADDALSAAVRLIESGGIVALKGLGGYQLVCDATLPDTVARLRAGKHRPAKPLAVMVDGVGDARGLAHVSRVEEDLLTSASRPIVLLTERPGAAILAESVHPGTDQVGVFLPYTPLHHLLMHDLGRPLVVTSGNRSSEPIAIGDAEARARLEHVADGFLVHDRAINARYDDSVSRVTDGRPALVRRARGYAPAPLTLPIPAVRALLATGAQLKHTFALAEGDHAILSPHIGDLADHDTFQAFEETLAHLSRLLAVRPLVIAHDMHPAYLSTQYAARWPQRRRLPVQHHHAHIASCAAEHGVTEPVIGIAYDGLGWGADGTLWGGELLIANLRDYQRVGRFATAPMPGGEAAIRRPARMALGYLLGGEPLSTTRIDPGLVAAFTDRLADREVGTVLRMVERGVNSPLASSAGRLFDAVASILGVRDDASYEGEAAIALEAAAEPGPAEPLPWRITRAGGLWVYDHGPTLAAALDGVVHGARTSELAAAFHATVVAMTVDMCARAAAETDLRTVCLSGGVFQNQRLTTGLLSALREHGFTALVNQDVPTNDGGISYGQAAVAAARMRGE